MTRTQILLRHRTSLRGRLRLLRLRSDALGIAKFTYVYEPPGLEHAGRLPVLYLFRGHEREWVNMAEDASRQRATAVEDLDKMIERGMIPPVLAVLPGLNSANNHIPSLGIDMAGTWPARLRGLGTGRFWTYLTDELMPAVAERYPQAEGGPRLMAGFSLGGFTVSLLATHLPGHFDHAGIYDGLFMWPGHRDPRKQGKGPCTDLVWCRAPIFDAAFGAPRDPEAMRRWNPADRLRDADDALLERLGQTRFHVRCAAGDGSSGNRDRARAFVRLLGERGLPITPGEVVLAPEAAHTWHWTDRFLVRFLVRAFGD